LGDVARRVLCSVRPTYEMRHLRPNCAEFPGKTGAMLKTRMSFAARIMGLVFILLAGMVVMQWINSWAGNQIQEKVVQPSFSRVVIDNKKQMTKNLVQTHVAVLSEKLKTIADPEERIKAVCEQTDTARFFDDKSGYLFVYDTDANCINSPNNKSRNGKNFHHEVDTNGKRIIDELDKAAMAGGDFVEYIFPKPGAGNAPKITYAMMIPGTDWFMGCGVYIDDVEREQAVLKDKVDALGRKNFKINIMLFAGVFAILLSLAIWLTRKISGAIHRALVLGRENMCLQLIIRMMGNVSVAAGLDSLIETLLRSVLEVIGGENIIIYYHIGDDLHRADAQGSQAKINQIDDPFVREVFERRKPKEIETNLGEAGTTDSKRACTRTWSFPLLDGHELVGVIKMENLQIGSGDLFGQLPVFFAYVASALKNEIAGQIRLMSHREAVASMEHVIAIVGHELRTPLAGLRAITELLVNPEMRQAESCGGFLNTMNKEVVRMSEMVNDLLEAARLDSGRAKWNWETLVMKDVCQEAIDSVSFLVDEQKVSLTCQVEPETLTMQGDAGAISRMLINLLGNSVKFTNSGEVAVVVQADEESPSWLTISVRDTGRGISPRILDKLGEPFALNSGMGGSDHVHGTGLGISICTRIVAAHGGEMTVESEEGKGTTFTARLRMDLAGPEQIQKNTNLIRRH
jgi:signal transduction histidine kinase